MTDQFVAEIRIFPFTFAPSGWAFCDGQLLPISQNSALFSLLGTTYGGDGKSTFALPNMQGNTPMHPDQGPGLRNHFLGEESGSQTVTLLQSEMPLHAHALNAGTQDPALAKIIGPDVTWALSQGGGIYQTSSNAQLDFSALAPAGGGQPHNNLQPYLTLNFCIALQGIFPPRS